MIDQNYGLILPRPFALKPPVGSSIWTPLSTAHGIDDILALILFIKRGAIILKYNLRDAF